jgi:hypothetical protein
MRHVISIHNGDFFFVDSVLRDAKNQPLDSREALIYMSPDQFLSLARPGSSVEKMQTTLTLMNRGIKYNKLPYLRCFTNQNGNLVVIGNGKAHEGRHRARVLRALGVTHLPVRIVSEIEDKKGPAYYWGKSAHRPKFLVGFNSYKVVFPKIRTKYR